MQEMKEMWVGSLGPEDPLEEGIATHSSILAWRIPGARRATVHGVGKSQTRLEQRNTHARGQGRWLHRQSFNKALPEDSMVWGRSPAVEAQCLGHWTTREVPLVL